MEKIWDWPAALFIIEHDNTHRFTLDELDINQPSAGGQEQN